jgi:hypothetical protein
MIKLLGQNILQYNILILKLKKKKKKKKTPGLYLVVKFRTE